MIKLILFFFAVGLSASFTSCTRALQSRPTSQPFGEPQAFSQKNISIQSKIVNGKPATWNRLPIRHISGDRFFGIQALSAINVRVAGDQGPLYETKNGGDTWRPIRVNTLTINDSDTPLNITDFYFSSSDLGWALATRTPSDLMDSRGFESWVLQTRNGGVSWQVQYSGKALELIRVLFTNEQEGWVVGTRRIKRETLQNDYFILHTTDQGKHWEDVSADLNNNREGRGSINDIYASSPSHATVLASRNQLFSTTNGGQTWAQVPASKNESTSEVMFRIGVLENKNLWVLAGTGGREGTWTILSVRDDKIWTEYELGGVLLRDAVFLSDTNVVACGVLASDDTVSLPDDDGKQGVILYSSDRGHNWSIIYRNAQDKSVNAISVVDLNNIWAVGDNGLVLRLEFPAELMPVVAGR